MATVIDNSNELLAGSLSSTSLGVYFLSASGPVEKVIFSTLNYLVTSARLSSDPLSAIPLSSYSATPQAPYITVTYPNTAGVSVSSGAGKLVFSSSYYGKPVYFYTSDRTVFSSVIPNSAGVLSLTAGGHTLWTSKEKQLRLLGYI